MIQIEAAFTLAVMTVSVYYSYCTHSVVPFGCLTQNLTEEEGC